MADWRVAKSLDKLLLQINGKWPTRRKSSDGSIGDANHASRSSDHNPWVDDGVVTARDFTHDPDHGFDSYGFAEHLRQTKDPRIKYCLAPQTKILDGELKWRAIDSFVVGDRLVAFDEHGPVKDWHPKNLYKTKKINHVFMSGQRMRSAHVEAIEVIKRPCFRISTDSSPDIVASEDHLWLAARALHGKYRTWVETKDLREGNPLQYFASPWEKEQTFEAGWLAGLFDGEGCLSRPNGGGWMLTVSQKEGDVLDHAIYIMESFGVDFEVYENGPVKSIGIRGGLGEILRFLGRFSSIRLTRKAIEESIWEGYSITGTGKVAIVEKIEPLGIVDVVAMQTSTRTLLAEGVFSHNCISNKRIFSSSENPWVWRSYNGANPHDQHVHVSVSATQKLYDSVKEWDIGDGVVPSDQPPPASADRPLTKLGDTGYNVEYLQRMLGLPDKGVFDEATELAVIEFQKRAGLVPDGRVGPYTWRVLDEPAPDEPDEPTPPQEPQSDIKHVVFKAEGKMSTFGGPQDTGMSKTEGLALYGSAAAFVKAGIGDWLLSASEAGASGVGRRLDPAKFYVACRWDYKVTPKTFLKMAMIRVSNPKNGKMQVARAVDWGPNVRTKRAADLSPGLATALGLETNDECVVEVFGEGETLLT